MTTEQLAALKEVAERATPGPWNSEQEAGFVVSVGAAICQFWSKQEDDFPNAQANAAHIAAFDPTTCLELIEEVERLRNQWNTRFNTLCGNCGRRYLGPRDEEQHGIGLCGDTK